MATVLFRGNYYRLTRWEFPAVPSPVAARSGYEIPFTEVKAGVSNPSWRDKVRKHINATTAYSCDRMSWKPVLGSYRAVYNTTLLGQRKIVEGRGLLVQALTLPQLGSSTGLENRAYSLFVSKANKEMRSLHGLVSLGELRETLHMIKHPLDALKRGLHDYVKEVPIRTRKAIQGQQRLSRRGVRRKSRKSVIARAISGTYLEYANGWKPFASDILAASKVLAEQFNPSGLGYRKVSATAKGPTVTVSPKTFISSLDADFSWYQTDVERREASCRLIGEVILQNMGDADALLNNAGFTLGEFWPTLWELLPLSYVVDYFANIGGLLEAYCFDSSKVTWTSQSTRLKSVRTHRGAMRPHTIADVPNGLIEYDGNPGEVTLTRVGLTRVAPVRLYPTLQWELPDRYLFSKLANVSSLLAQAKSSSKQIAVFYR